MMYTITEIADTLELDRHVIQYEILRTGLRESRRVGKARVFSEDLIYRLVETLEERGVSVDGRKVRKF